MPQGEVVIDPFTGQSLSREELDELLAPYRRRQGLVGEFDVPLGLFLQAATARDVLARMLRNLKEIHRSAEDWPRLLAVQQRLVILLPEGGKSGATAAWCGPNWAIAKRRCRLADLPRAPPGCRRRSRACRAPGRNAPGRPPPRLH